MALVICDTSISLDGYVTSPTLPAWGSCVPAPAAVLERARLELGPQVIQEFLDTEALLDQP